MKLKLVTAAIAYSLSCTLGAAESTVSATSNNICSAAQNLWYNTTDSLHTAGMYASCAGDILLQQTGHALKMSPSLLTGMLQCLGWSSFALWATDKITENCNQQIKAKKNDLQKPGRLNPSILKHLLRTGIIIANGCMLTRTAGGLHGVDFHMPARPVEFAGRAVSLLGVGAALLALTDYLGDKLHDRKYLAPVLKTAMYLGTVCITGVGLTVSYGLSQ